MSVEVCMASRNSSLRSLIQRVFKSRGHRFSEAANPVECVQHFQQDTRQDCRVIIAEYAGPETLEMIDVAIDRAHVKPENVAVLSIPSAHVAEEASDYGFCMLKRSFQLSKLSSWMKSSARRCTGQTSA